MESEVCDGTSLTSVNLGDESSRGLGSISFEVSRTSIYFSKSKKLFQRALLTKATVTAVTAELARMLYNLQPSFSWSEVEM
jgi:hypothetical protein